LLKAGGSSEPPWDRFVANCRRIAAAARRDWSAVLIAGITAAPAAQAARSSGDRVLRAITVCGNLLVFTRGTTGSPIGSTAGPLPISPRFL